MAAPNLAVPDRRPTADPIAEQELVDRVRQGDEAAFEKLYEQYFPRVFHFVARRLRNRADTEETVQEVFVNVFSSIHSFRGEAPFGAWVFGLTRRTLAGRFKKRRLSTVPLEDEDVDERVVRSFVQQEPDPLEMFEYRERLAQLSHTVACELSAEQRELFEMHHLEHRSIQEIAERTSRSLDAVKSHLYRARKVLLAR